MLTPDEAVKMSSRLHMLAYGEVENYRLIIRRIDERWDLLSPQERLYLERLSDKIDKGVEDKKLEGI